MAKRNPPVLAGGGAGQGERPHRPYSSIRPAEGQAVSEEPLFDREAEEALAAALLFFPETVPEILSGLTATDLYTDRARAVWEAAARLSAGGQEVNLGSIYNALPPDAREGFLTWATALEGKLVGPSFVPGYIRAVKEMAERRALRQLALELLAGSGEGNPAALREEALRRLQEVGRRREEEEASPPEGGWPDPPDRAAFYGLAGDIVRAIEPHSEADPVALLIQVLVAFGNAAGRSAHYRVEADRHYLNLFAVLVGTTSRGRKGTSWGHVWNLFRLADGELGWATSCVEHGLSSGEGLIWRVRDEIRIREPVREKGRVVDYQEVVVDEGVRDKRLLILEAEFASALRVLQREGNTLSPVIRCAWDHGYLTVLTKNSRARATDAHVSIIGHITKPELLRYLDSTEMANGFGNRFLWVCVRRSKCLPEGGKLHQENLHPLVQRLRAALDFARRAGEVTWDDEARALWHQVYPDLSEGRPGLLGAMTARAEAQVVRLACIYACLDCSDKIRLPHLRAALALWRYCEDSARFIFGASLGDPVADEILRALKNAPNGLTRTDIRDLFGRNKAASEIGRALRALVENGLARCVREDTDGRPAERWYALTTKTTETTKARPLVVNVVNVVSDETGNHPPASGQGAGRMEGVIEDDDVPF